MYGSHHCELDVYCTYFTLEIYTVNIYHNHLDVGSKYRVNKVFVGERIDNMTTRTTTTTLTKTATKTTTTTTTKTTATVTTRRENHTY